MTNYPPFKKLTMLEEQPTTTSDHTILLEFTLEGKINDRYSKKGFPQRITCGWTNEDQTVLRFMLRGHCQAIFVMKDKDLYRVGSLKMQWMAIKRAVVDMYPETMSYE